MRIERVLGGLPFEARDHVHESWDTYWEEVVSGLQWAWFAQLWLPAYRYWPLFQELAVGPGKSVVFFGSGISVLPWFLCAVGADVFAVEASSVATDFASAHPPRVAQWGEFFGGGSLLVDARWPEGKQAYWPAGLDWPAESIADVLREIPRRFAEIRAAIPPAIRPGGRLRFEAADLLRWAPPAQSCDLVVVLGGLDTMAPDDVDRVLANIGAGLTETGVLLVETTHVTGSGAPGRPTDAALRAAGFRVETANAAPPPWWKRLIRRRGCASDGPGAGRPAVVLRT